MLYQEHNVSYDNQNVFNFFSPHHIWQMESFLKSMASRVTCAWVFDIWTRPTSECRCFQWFSPLICKNKILEIPFDRQNSFSRNWHIRAGLPSWICSHRHHLVCTPHTNGSALLIYVNCNLITKQTTRTGLITIKVIKIHRICHRLCNCEFYKMTSTIMANVSKGIFHLPKSSSFIEHNNFLFSLSLPLFDCSNSNLIDSNENWNE